MGSSSESNTKGIHPSAGGLVWVRRRNGSWWPGRILGPEELPESCLASPRSGTPVKLLGREDASVDWYNLEKSKRVKAFRCGEYEECIEKAKASVANSSKKVVKYARREDAIIHALEIESARQSKQRPGLCSRTNDQGVQQCGGGESPIMFNPDKETDNTTEESSSFEDDSDSAQELSHSGVSFEEPNHTSMEQSLQGIRWRTPNDSEDDGTEGIKRMRGLSDLGVGVVPSLKRKRSQVAHVHEYLKRKNRRRTLAKVLENTAMVSVPVLCEELSSPTGSSLPGASESKISGLESNESKNFFSMACDTSLLNCAQKENEICSISRLPENDSSGTLYDVPLFGEEGHSAGFSPIMVSSDQKPQVGAGAQSSQCSQVETISLGNEDLNESGSASSGAADINISDSIEKGTSKWQSKGKRNTRHTRKGKRQDLTYAFDVDDGVNPYLSGMKPRGMYSLACGQKVDCKPIGGPLTSDSSQTKFRPVTETLDEPRGWTSHISHKEPHTRTLMAEVQAPQRALPYRLSRFTVNPKYDSSDFSFRTFNAGSSLYDVNLEVKASYRPQHVPYISLMSKLNGQPIIGHPLTVEVLDYVSCDALMSSSECDSSSCDLDDDLDENSSALQDADMVYQARPISGGGRIPTKHSQSHKSRSKLPKVKKNGLLSKKIRKLSSLTGSHKQSEEGKKPVVEKLKGPSIACVPLKIVFSRINAALSNSTRPAHRNMLPTKP